MVKSSVAILVSTGVTGVTAIALKSSITSDVSCSSNAPPTGSVGVA